MNATTLQLAAAALSGTALPSCVKFLWLRLKGDARAEAETHKLNVEAARMEWQTLREEIDRQAVQIKALRTEIHDLKNSFTVRESELLQENKSLHAEVGRLTRRVEGLESILKVTPLPADMKALLEEIDRKTAKRGRQ